MKHLRKLFKRPTEAHYYRPASHDYFDVRKAMNAERLNDAKVIVFIVITVAGLFIIDVISKL